MLNFPAGVFAFGGSGRLDGAVTNTGFVQITDGIPKLGRNLSQAVFNNAGTVVHTDGQLGLFDRSTINNMPGGIYELRMGTAAAFGNDNGTTGNLFNNEGLLRRDGAGVASFNAVPLLNKVGGEIEVLNGTLQLNTSSTLEGGFFDVRADAVLSLADTTLTLAGTVTGSGPGIIRFDAGTLTGVAGATLNFPAGLFEFGGGAQFEGTLRNDGFVQITDGAPDLGRNLGTGVFNNAGTIVHSGGVLDLFFGSTVNNLASGIYELQVGAQTAFAAGNGSVGNSFFNAGLLRRAGAGGADSFVPVTNSGIVDLQAGSLAFFGGFNQTAGSTVLGGGAIGGNAGVTLTFQGGELRGAGSVGSSVNNSGATVRPGGTGAVGTIAIAGGYTQDPGGTLAFEANGSGAGQFDQLTVGGTATLGGTLNIDFLGAFAPAFGDNFQVVASGNNPGTFATLTGDTAGIAQTASATGLVISRSSLTFIWDAGAGGDTSWFNPINWDRDSGFPTVGDTAILGINTPIDLSASDATVGSFQQSTGTLTGDQSLSVTSSFVWSGGTQSGTGTTALASGGTGTLSGTVTLNGRTLDNDGVMVNSGRVNFSGTGQLHNLAGGVYEIARSAGGTVLSGAASVPGFFNAGTVRHSLAVTSSVNAPFNNTAGGVIETTAGIVDFNTDGAWGNTQFLISAGAEVRLNDGTKTWTGTFTGAGGGILRLGGGTQGASEGGFLTPGAGGATLNFPSGFFHFSGNATITSGGVLTNTGEFTISNQPDLEGTIDNAGVVRNLGHLDVAAGARFNNLAGATFELGRVGGGTVASGAGEFINAGTIRLIEAGTHTIAVPWNNLAGTSIDVMAGTLAFHSAGIWEGANIQIATGSAVTLNSGDKVWTGTFSGTGGGIVRLGGGTQGASAGGLVTVGTGGATLNFPNGGFEFSGNASLAGEALTNAGKVTFVDRPNLGLTINNTGTMINQGQIDFSATGRINNQVGGVFEIAKVAGGGFTSGGSSVPGIFNAGTLLLAINADLEFRGAIQQHRLGGHHRGNPPLPRKRLHPDGGKHTTGGR